MTSKTLNLWPTAMVFVETLSPLAILRTQAQKLTEITQGLLEGEVKSFAEGSDEVVHQLEIVAPALNAYRHRILSVKHNKDLVYPVQFSSGKVEDEEARANGILLRADSQADFIKMLSGALQSGYVVSVISSLIARINEARVEPETAATKELQTA